MKTLLISFSGGRTSAFMTQWLLESEKYKDYKKVVIFANTGKEREETLDFVNECDDYFGLNVIWLEAQFLEEHGKRNWFKVVDYKSASRNGAPFEAFIQRERIPNSAYGGCSSRLKSRPIHKFMRANGYKDYYTAIGIRADETQRINWESANKNKYIYPLVTDVRVDSKYIRSYWSAMPFDLRLRDYEGNCDMCWKKSKRKLLTLIHENPKLIEWWAEMEEKYGEGEYSFFRNNETSADLIKELDERIKGNRFDRVLDEHDVRKMQYNLEFDNDLDVGASCFCK